jgi:hypothetical protein
MQAVGIAQDRIRLVLQLADGTMAKSKRAASARAPSNRQPTAVTIRGSKEWRAWVERGAKYCRTDSSKLFDVAVAQYLKAQGFDEPPPER